MFPAFADVPGYPLVFPLFWGAFAIFLLELARHLRIFAAAGGPGPRGLDRWPRRLGGLIRFTILQTRMFRDAPSGLIHYGIFLGSTITLLGNANAVTGGLPQAILSWPFDGWLWAIAVGLQNLVSVTALVGVAFATYRRLVGRPIRLLRTRTAMIILAMIATVVITETVAQAFEVARFGDVRGALVGNALAVPLRGLPEAATEAAFAGFWWAHFVAVSAFLIYIPTNKHFHIYLSFVNVWFRKLAPRGELPAMDLEREDATFGLRTLQDLGWKDVLDGFTCTECGRCTDA